MLHSVRSRTMLTLMLLGLTPMIFAQLWLPTGGPIEVQYNEAGLWNYRPNTRGLLARFGTQRDVSYPGNPWQQVSIAFTDGCDGTNYLYQGNESFGAYNWHTTVFVTQMNLGGAVVGSFTKWVAFPLEITKTERWDRDGQIMEIEFTVTNIGCCDVDELVVMHAVDADQDRQLSPGTYNTINDTISVLNPQDFVYSEGPLSMWTVAYGQCDRTQDLGHTNWQTNPYVAINDYNGQNIDHTMHLRQNIGVLSPGEGFDFSFLFIVGRDLGSTIQLYKDNKDRLCDCTEESPYPYDPINPDTHFIPVALDPSHILKPAKRALIMGSTATPSHFMPVKPTISFRAEEEEGHPFNVDPVGHWEELVRYG